MMKQSQLRQNSRLSLPSMQTERLSLYYGKKAAFTDVNEDLLVVVKPVF
jgi:phosphate transport system ATP-binding protein